MMVSEHICERFMLDQRADITDLLDDFSAAKIETKAPAAPAPAPNPPSVPAPTLPPGLEDENLEELLNDDEFAKQLQAGMADLIGEIEKSVRCDHHITNHTVTKLTIL